MAEQWILNASPLIILSKVNQQHLLTALAGELAVPQAVMAEIHAGPADDPAIRFLSTSSLPIISVMPDPTILAWDLGVGEQSLTTGRPVAVRVR